MIFFYFLRASLLYVPRSLEISGIVAQQSAVLSLNYADFQPNPQRFLQISKFLEL